MVQKIEEIFTNINLECFNIQEGGVRALSTKSLSKEEKQNRYLDFVSGIEIIDGEFRMYVIEGISERGMRQFELNIPREVPNSEGFKILRNKHVLFKDRIYMQFNITIKKIKIREKLTELLMSPDLYIRTKVPQNIQDCLVNIQSIRAHWNLKNVAEFNIFPLSEDLIAIERKYSDSLSDEDLLGY